MHEVRRFERPRAAGIKRYDDDVGGRDRFVDDEAWAFRRAAKRAFQVKRGCDLALLEAEQQRRLLEVVDESDRRRFFELERLAPPASAASAARLLV